MKRIAIIPARGGSKRIPDKNIRSFCGEPMVAHIISAALSSGLFDEIHVSTDSKEIVKVVAELGLKVAFMRPPHLADDHTPIMPVLKYVLEEYQGQGLSFDTVAMLMACAPMITAEDLRGGAALYDSLKGKRAVLGVAEYPCPIEWAFRREPSGVLVPTQPGMFSVRSQDLSSAYYDAGQFCFMSSQRILSTVGAGSDEGFLGYPIQRHQAIDIDTMDDWRFAELVYTSIR
ncbi:pseudaminic acid cytidylyltransferase [Rhodoferax sp. TS-BS-61-7]|uniref:pseudaminic acid cytidylyltransferase n=1 Tax=Rhodoferax sp. TS-BS-61-7 TaxID=2094194 RepID=UPI000CF652B0|nr:pseudaminic acid cytidylyltransferase [Rhodoferax sp. TS-BS-61-7]PQA76619.1 pseudaminic acid cytidylyltransferase [Rhodoferax sp. TS-BS-61-7]